MNKRVQFYIYVDMSNLNFESKLKLVLKMAWCLNYCSGYEDFLGGYEDSIDDYECFLPSG